MPHTEPKTEEAVDRLTLQLLQGVYCDLASVLKLSKPRGAQTVFEGLEQRVVEALTRLSAEDAGSIEGDRTLHAVGERINAILELAHNPDILSLAA